MVRLGGLEPPTRGLEGRCSILLSYRRSFVFSRLAEAPGLDENEVSIWDKALMAVYAEADTYRSVRINATTQAL